MTDEYKKLDVMQIKYKDKNNRIKDTIINDNKKMKYMIN